MTEGCRGEGGILVNKDGYRYLQDYGLGPETPIGKPQNKYMELGPRDKVSQAFWQELQKGNTLKTAKGVDVVHLDLRHLGEKYLHERLPFICELAQAYEGVDPVKSQFLYVRLFTIQWVVLKLILNVKPVLKVYLR